MAQRVKVRVRKKKSKKKKIFKRILVLFLLLIICMGGFAVYKIVNTLQAADKTYDELNRGEKSKLRDAVIDIKKKPFSVLLSELRIMPQMVIMAVQIHLLSQQLTLKTKR